MKKYHRLSFQEREEISRGLARDESYRDIAHHLGRYASTVSREIEKRKMTKETYRAASAHENARRKAKKRRVGKRKLATNNSLYVYLREKLEMRWSPVQIAKRLIREYPNNMAMRISPEAVYAYLYVVPRGTLKKHLLSRLRQQHKYRRKHQKNKVKRRGRIPGMVSIEQRPSEIATRLIPGHWEGDLVLGKARASALGTLVERTTRFTLLAPLRKIDRTIVRKSFAKEMKTLPKQLARSLTYDQGMEMVDHRLFTKTTSIQVYFAHASSPWERGTNENTNGLIRQFFPKGTDFTKVSWREIKHAQYLLNDRPRQVLDWQTPAEVFNQLLH